MQHLRAVEAQARVDGRDFIDAAGTDFSLDVEGAKYTGVGTFGGTERLGGIEATGEVVDGTAEGRVHVSQAHIGRQARLPALDMRPKIGAMNAVIAENFGNFDFPRWAKERLGG